MRGSSIEHVTRFAVALLGRRDWVRVEALAAEAGVSRASAYRYARAFADGGWPIEFDSDRDHASQRGIRSMLVVRRRPDDGVGSAVGSAPGRG